MQVIQLAFSKKYIVCDATFLVHLACTYIYYDVYSIPYDLFTKSEDLLLTW